MAEFALGLTKTALEGTVSRVKSAIDEDAKLNVRVQNDLVFITGEFEMMRFFLNAANKERVSNQVVRTWVRQIRDLAFDVEDCLEFVVHLDTNKPWAWLWRVVPSCMAPPQPIDEAVAEIQRLKARVEDVSHRNARYNLIGDSGTISKTTALVTTVSKLPAPELMHDPDASSSAFHILRDVWEAAGKMRRDMGDLKKVINNQGSVLEVISLLGGPGSAADLGVTHIIREAYNDPKICKEFKSRAWVKLMHPFNPDEFLKSLLTQFYASSHRAKVLDAEFRRKMREAVDKEDDLMKAQLMQQVSDEQRYLVIVEQLSSVSEWDTIRMYLRDSTTHGNRIVVTTQQLGLALSCTGNPYQVSELRQFSYGQSLCAFFSKVSGRRSDMAELIWQLRDRDGGVISVWGRTRDETTLVYKVYTGITQKSKEFEGVEFKRHSWVDVPDPFDLGVFSRHLFFNFHSDDLRAAEIKAAGMMGDTGLIEGCCKFLCEDDCLVVINGLNSTDDWDHIKAAFFSEPSRGCIIVITEEESVARHCADKVDRVLNVGDLDADVLLRHSIKGCEYYGIGGKEASRRGRFFSNDRMKEARDWMDKFGLFVDRTGLYRVPISNFGVICLREIDSAEKSALARKFYYEQMLHLFTVDFNFTEFSWVDVPDPFDLTDFCWRLLLDFYSDDLEAKQTTAVGMMEGCQNPIQGCLELLRQHKCFVVIDGLRSGDDWDQIKQALSFKTSGFIIVITKEKSLHLGDGVKFIDAPDCYRAGQPSIKLQKPGYSDQDVSRAFSSRIIKACDWIKNFVLCGHLQSQLPKLRQGSVTSVWGIAGIGKSYLIRRLYYTSMIGCYNHLRFSNLQPSDKYSWVDVPHPFDLTDLSRRLLLDFHSDDLEAKETAAVGMMEGQDPIQVCREFLHQHICLVVIDGLRSKDDWDLIKSAFLSEPINKCYTIVVTNEESIAKHCVDKEEDVVNVKGLNVDEALNLFNKIANFGSKELTSNEEELSRLTMTKCGGIPEVLAAIGNYCQEWKYFDLSPINRKGGSKWNALETINADFMGMLETDPAFHSLRGLFDWMRSYFDACPDSLKPCIFYLSVFPLGHGIRRRRLLRRWIAEGYSMDTPSSTAEENGEEFFSKLVKLSIIQEQQQQSFHGKAKKCQVNGFFREYIISRPMQDNLVFALEGRCIPNSQRAGQHLTISTSWDRDKILLESLELSRLRSLTVFGEWRSFFMSTDVKMRLLRVLDLEDTLGVTDGDMEQIGKLLPRLKFLSLRGCKDITRLPSSMGGLRQLQTLDIKGTSIVMLPPAIMKLEKLQYVRAGTSPEDDNGPVAGITRPPAAADGDGASTSHSPATALTSSTTAPVDGDGESTSQPLAASAAATTPVDGDGESTSQPLAASAAADDEARTSTPCRPRGGLVFSWLSKLHRHGLVSSAHGVQFPVVAAGGIGKLTALHTLGVVNVGGASGKAVLRELKKLTQLRKLKLSGINHKNWVDFCSFISGHGYLESLSVRLDEDPKSASPVFACFSDISEPPKTLKTLKVYGRKNAQISPVWIKQLHNLTKNDLELTVSTQEDIDALADLPRGGRAFGSLCVKPIQDGELRFDWGDRRGVFVIMKVLEIYCSSSEIVFRPSDGQFLYIDVLVVHCSSSTEASLELSGLGTIFRLGKVLLKGSYSDALEQDLRQQVGRLPRRALGRRLEEVRFETDPSSS